MVHFQPKRQGDDRETTLDDEDEENLKDANREDVVLDMALHVMARLIAELNGGGAR